MPLAIGRCLEYAIYHSPLLFIRTLLEIGADPNPNDQSGFPPLIAALSCSRSHPGSPGRQDVLDILKLLLSFGADPNQRGLNDYTPLHMAVSERNLPAIELLLEEGANPLLRTRIDEYETPRETAVRAGLSKIAALLAEDEASAGKVTAICCRRANFWGDCFREVCTLDSSLPSQCIVTKLTSNGRLEGRPAKLEGIIWSWIPCPGPRTHRVTSP